HVSRNTVGHADPQRSIVVGGPVAPSNGNGRQVRVPQRTGGHVFFKLNEILLGQLSLGCHPFPPMEDRILPQRTFGSPRFRSPCNPKRDCHLGAQAAREQLFPQKTSTRAACAPRISPLLITPPVVSSWTHCWTSSQADC